MGSVSTVRSGYSWAPITIKGPETGKDPDGRYKAIVTGWGVVFRLNHSHYRLSGFTITGNPDIPRSAYPTDLSQVEAFKDANQSKIITTQLIYAALDPKVKNLTGIVIDDMMLTSSGGECVHFRNAAYKNSVTNSVIQWCGMMALPNTGFYRYYVGEGVYIGTSPYSTSAPMYENDPTNDIVVRGNTIHTYGAECVDIKENAYNNTFEENDCRYSLVPQSSLGSGLWIQGFNNRIRNNVVADHVASNISMMWWSEKYDRGGNTVTGNTFARTDNAHMRVTQRSPGAICGNTFDDSAPILYGTLAGDPAATC